MSRQRGNQRRTDPELIRAKRQRVITSFGRIAAMVVVVVSVVGSLHWMNQRFTVTEWQVEGDDLLVHAVREQLEKMPNRDYLHTRPDALAQAWQEQMPDIDRVEIERQLPEGLRVRVTARVPAGLWQDAQKRLFLFDQKGNAYRPLKKGESPDLPLLRVARDQLAHTHRLMQLIRAQQIVAPQLLSEIQMGDGYWKVYFSKGVAWKLPFGEEQVAITRISKLMKQPRWANRGWRIDARMESRWFIRPARHGGVI